MYINTFPLNKFYQVNDARMKQTFWLYWKRRFCYSFSSQQGFRCHKNINSQPTVLNCRLICTIKTYKTKTCQFIKCVNCFKMQEIKQGCMKIILCCNLNVWNQDVLVFFIDLKTKLFFIGLLREVQTLPLHYFQFHFNF